MEAEKYNEQSYSIELGMHPDPTANALLNIAKAIHNLAEAVAGSYNVRGLVDTLHTQGTPALASVFQHGFEELTVSLQAAIRDGAQEIAWRAAVAMSPG
jgi:hypothetical protein